MQRDWTPAGALHTAAFSAGLVGAARLSQSARSYANVISLRAPERSRDSFRSQTRAELLFRTGALQLAAVR